MIFDYTDTYFVQADVILRRGGHVSSDDVYLYETLARNFDNAKRLYEAYGCNLVQHEDGFFFLVMDKDSALRTKALSKSCMHLGMVIAILTRDPEITRSSGTISEETVLQYLAALPRDVLQKTYAPKRREATLDQGIRKAVRDALKQLGELGFIRWRGEQRFQPSAAINRFAEMARHGNDPDTTARLFLMVQRGVIFDSLDEVADDDTEDDNLDDVNGYDGELNGERPD